MTHSIMSDSNSNSGIIKIIGILSATVGLVAVVLTCTKNGLEATKSGIEVTRALSTLSPEQQDVVPSSNRSETNDPITEPLPITPDQKSVSVDREKITFDEAYDLTGNWTDNTGYSYEITQNGMQLILVQANFPPLSGTIVGKKGKLTGINLNGQQVEASFRIQDNTTIVVTVINIFGLAEIFTLSRN